jgi:hypothetical protein
MHQATSASGKQTSRPKRSKLTGVLPEFLGLDEREAATGVPLSALLMGVHPQDRERVAHLVHEAHSRVGRFEAEFQTIDSNGGVHRVSARGRVETDEHGHGLRCIGVALNVTDSYSEEVVAKGQQLNTIDRIVDALIAVRPLVEEIGSPVLSTLIDVSLLEVGKLLARQSNSEKRHFH